MTTRRDFLKHSALGAAGLTIGGLGFSTESYANIMGANEKIRVGIVRFFRPCPPFFDFLLLWLVPMS